MYALEAATNETLRVEHSVLGVHGSLVLRRITNETLLRGEGDVGGRCPVTLCLRCQDSTTLRCRKVLTVVSDDLDTVILPDADTSMRTAMFSV